MLCPGAVQGLPGKAGRRSNLHYSLRGLGRRELLSRIEALSTGPLEFFSNHAPDERLAGFGARADVLP